MSVDLQKFAETFGTEEELRSRLATLLTKMGNQEVQILHGTQEYGKDLIFYSQDGFDNRMLNACVVKNGKITGSADDNQGARTVLNQVEQALDTPVVGSGGEDEMVARVFVISPYDCPQPTMRSIQGKLKARSGQVDFLCGSRLLERFATHWPEFLAFESTMLGVYVASIQRVFEQEDPLRFLGAQHSLFAGASKSLKSVYVRQGFRLETFELEFLVEPPHLANLDHLVGRDALMEVVEELRFVAAFIRNPQAWESGDALTAEKLAAFLESLADNLSKDWKDQWTRYEIECGLSASPVTPQKIMKFTLRNWPEFKGAQEFKDLQNVLMRFAGLVREANQFARQAQRQGLTIADLHSEPFRRFGQVREVLRTHPSGFRRHSRPISQKFPEDLLDRVSKPLFVAAPAGYGKTSFCKWNTLNDIQSLIDKSASIFPIYVPLHKLSTNNLNSCEDAFFRAPESVELVEIAKKNGQRVRLYLDGLDEVSTPEQQEKLMLLASRVAQNHPEVQVVVTGRDYLSGVWLRWLTRVELAELDGAQVEVLIANWLDSDPGSLALFREELAKTPALRGLMGIPLLGTLIIAVFRQRRSLPDNKLRLYEVFIDLMCGGWDLAKNVRRDTRFGSHLKLSILTRLAGQLHINGRRDAQEENIKSSIDQTSPALTTQWRSVLDEILGDGLLVRAGANAYLFSHLSFQEYLAATELPDPQGTRSEQALKSFLRGDDWWREALTFYVSLIKRPDETEAWIKRTVEQIARKGFDITERYRFLIEALAAAWPGWSPKKAAPNNQS
jgi:hypothetical protein